MRTIDALMPTLRERLRIASSLSSVDSSLPILFFGDALTARVATIGLNPSKFEFVGRTGRTLLTESGSGDSRLSSARTPHA